MTKFTTFAFAAIASLALAGTATAGDSKTTYQGWTSGGGSASASTDCGCKSKGEVSATALNITASAGAAYTAGKDVRAGGLGLTVNYAGVEGRGATASASGGYEASGKASIGGKSYGRRN
jgi:hypothetical protein